MNSLPCSHVQSPTALIAQPDAVILDLPTDSGEAAIRYLHTRLSGLPEVTNSSTFLSDLLERAAMSSVCIASDVALPHARTTAVRRTVLAVGRSAGPVAFDPEHPAVRLVFLIGTPKEAVTEYLQLVAALSRMLKNDQTRAALLSAATEAEFRAWLARGTQK